VPFLLRSGGRRTAERAQLPPRHGVHDGRSILCSRATWMVPIRSNGDKSFLQTGPPTSTCHFCENTLQTVQSHSPAWPHHRFNPTNRVNLTAPARPRPRPRPEHRRHDHDRSTAARSRREDLAPALPPEPPDVGPRCTPPLGLPGATGRRS
jgi:hypothetical protein